MQALVVEDIYFLRNRMTKKQILDFFALLEDVIEVVVVRVYDVDEFNSKVFLCFLFGNFHSTLAGQKIQFPANLKPGFQVLREATTLAATTSNLSGFLSFLVSSRCRWT